MKILHKYNILTDFVPPFCTNGSLACPFFLFIFVPIMITLAIILGYFGLLMLFSRLSSRGATNESFFRGDRRSRWYMVAFGMVGASISGVTYVSVPGMVLFSDMTYLQMCFGFIVGYVVVAFVLLPVYYRLNLTTIYSYLQQRFGNNSYLTGSAFFVLSKLVGASIRFYVAAFLLHGYIGAFVSIPFWLTVLLLVSLIWLYTRRGGIRTLVKTDVVQTFVMFSSLLVIIWAVMRQMDMSVGDAVRAIAADSHSRIFVWDDWFSRQHFVKQFLSGIFVVIVMTGLDQDMMQKNLTCKTLRDAQKDMCSYGVAFVPANLLFLSLGVLLVLLTQMRGDELPVVADRLVPMYAATGLLGQGAMLLFLLGILSSAFSSADSAMTALTTTVCVDWFGRPTDEGLRRKVHLCMAGSFAVCMLLFHGLGSPSLIDAIYTICGYTYGPLLGLFAFGLFMRFRVADRAVPFIAVASPVLCWVLNRVVEQSTGYVFGYELLLLNGLFTFAGLFVSSLFAGRQQRI